MKILIALTILLNLTVLLSCASSGQGVRLKKDTLYIDKKETPIKVDLEYNTPDEFYAFHQTYTFREGEKARPFLVVDYKGVQLPGSYEKKVWLEISDAERSRTNSVDFKGGLILSKNKIINEMLTKYQFFDRSGIVDHGKISDFMTSGVQSDAKRLAENILEEKRSNAEYLEAIDPFVAQDLTVTKGGVLGEPIGRLEILQDARPMGSLVIGTYDLADNVIASAKIESNVPMVSVSLIDGRSFEYYTQYGLSAQVGGAGFMNELIEQIILKGFSLGYSYDDSLMTSKEADVHATP